MKSNLFTFRKLAAGPAIALLFLGSVISGQALGQTDPVGYDPTLAPSNAISFDIEGCRLDKATEGTYDPNATPPVLTCDSSAVWPDGADAYTDGNLGKEWNELDLVPHRIGSDTAGLTTADETYQVVVGADNQTDDDPLKIGFDRVVNFVFNEALSTGDTDDCQLQLVGDNQIGDFGIGGADLQIVQVLQITQTADTLCVWDYVERLAITSSLISGSSTRSFIFAGTGAQSVPIPSDIQPQVLDKTMSAVEDSLINWTIAKEVNPVNFNFGNTCNADVFNTKDIIVDITFTKGETEVGDLTATTMVDATNPSSRVVYYDCTDVVYSGDTAVDTAEPDPFEVPPSQMVMFDIEHILNPETRDLRDELTCTLQVVDILDPPNLIDVGELSAEFSLPNDDIAPGDVVNETVVVTDTESITLGADRYDFSAVQSGGVTGAFDGYTPGDLTDGPVVWNSESQNDSGTVQFTKTVQVERGYDVNGKLEDTASIDLTGTIGVTATASTTFSTDPKIDLVINKELGFTVLNDTVWQFEVKDSGGNVEANVDITITGGFSSGTVTVPDLDPDTYTVSETVLPGWVPSANPQNVTLSLPSCEGSVTFTNNPAADFFAEVEVQKMTDPTGQESNWTFDLIGSAGGETAQVTTDDANFKRFNLNGGNNQGADAGAYSMTEVPQAGWDLQADISFSKVGCIESGQNTGPSTVDACDFTVQYERDAGCVFQCTYENIQRGTIIVEKQTDPDGSTQEFEFSGDAAGSISDGGQIVVSNLVPGTYTSIELVPDGWDLTDIQCDDGGSTNPSSGDLGTATATFELDPGETVTCVFTNVERGMVDLYKFTNGTADPIAPWDFTLNGPEVDETDSTPPPLVDFGGAKLIPGEEYTLCEINIPPSWTLMWAIDINVNRMFDMPPDVVLPFVGCETSLTGDGLYQVYDPDPACGTTGAVNDTRCVNFEVEPGETLSFIIDNQRPGGEPRTPGYWKNWSTCTGGGQVDTAAENGGPAAGWFLLDDLLPQTIGALVIDNCYDGVNILDHRDLGGRNKKRASDAAYKLARNLLAAKLNLSAGAETCQAVVDAVTAGDALLTSIDFDGTGQFLRPRDAEYADATTLAGTLDEYNNGYLCN